MHELAIIKLITGETLICNMRYIKDENYVMIKDPLQFSLNASQTGSSLIASKWIETDQTEFKIKTWHIVAAATPSLYIEEIYLESIADLNEQQEVDENQSEESEIDFYLDRMEASDSDDFNVH